MDWRRTDESIFLCLSIKADLVSYIYIQGDGGSATALCSLLANRNLITGYSDKSYIKLKLTVSTLRLLHQ